VCCSQPTECFIRLSQEAAYEADESKAPGAAATGDGLGLQPAGAAAAPAVEAKKRYTPQFIGFFVISNNGTLPSAPHPRRALLIHVLAW
jgi:hypothetical protein